MNTYFKWYVLQISSLPCWFIDTQTFSRLWWPFISQNDVISSPYSSTYFQLVLILPLLHLFSSIVPFLFSLPYQHFRSFLESYPCPQRMEDTRLQIQQHKTSHLRQLLPMFFRWLFPCWWILKRPMPKRYRGNCWSQKWHTQGGSYPQQKWCFSIFYITLSVWLTLTGIQMKYSESNKKK